jgi:hypothetical protein
MVDSSEEKEEAMSSKSVLLVLAICMIGTVALAADQRSNVRFTSAPVADTCFITDTIYGAPVTTVQISEHGGTEYLYWMDWQGPYTTVLKFVIKYVSTAMVTKEVQTLKNGASGEFVTPFAVTWGAFQAGPAVLKVKSNAGTCAYYFTVTGL